MNRGLQETARNKKVVECEESEIGKGKRSGPALRDDDSLTLYEQKAAKTQGRERDEYGHKVQTAAAG